MARVHAVLLTAFLWHVTAITVGAGVARALGAPEPAIGSGLWWALRPAWLVWLLPFLAVLRVGLRAVRDAPARAGRSPTIRWPRPPPGFGVFAVAVGILGFGETGFFPFAPEVGEHILMFTFNPLQDLIHVVLGGAVLWALGWRRRAAAGLAAAGAAVFLAMGALRLGDWGPARWLGMDDFTAWAHVVVGAAALVALGGDRRCDGGARVAGLRESASRHRDLAGEAVAQGEEPQVRRGVVQGHPK